MAIMQTKTYVTYANRIACNALPLQVAKYAWLAFICKYRTIHVSPAIRIAPSVSVRISARSAVQGFTLWSSTMKRQIPQHTCAYHVQANAKSATMSKYAYPAPKEISSTSPRKINLISQPIKQFQLSSPPSAKHALTIALLAFTQAYDSPASLVFFLIQIVPVRAVEWLVINVVPQGNA